MFAERLAIKVNIRPNLDDLAQIRSLASIIVNIIFNSNILMLTFDYF